MITKYGLDNFIPMIVLGIIIGIIAFYTRFNLFISIPLWVISLFLIFMALWFFRDPERNVPPEFFKANSILVSPADGTILEIVEDFENDYIKGKTKRISIFLSPLDVHVNRIPLSGEIEYFKFIEGKKLIASKSESSFQNQQTHIGLHNPNGKILFKQIVGAVARRLVWDIKVGDKVQIGQKFGMMKFGSRMDIHISPNSEIYVKVGDKVVAAETKIARINAN